jgi:hypothetical protein
MHSRSKYRYELVDNETNEVLVSGPSAHVTLHNAAAYIIRNGISCDEVTYKVAANAGNRVDAFTATGEELSQLLEDETGNGEEDPEWWDDDDNE